MYKEFEKWMNDVLDQNMTLPGVAINFNLYEDEDSHWSIQLISTAYFDEEDDDWACDEVFTTGENLFSWQQDEGWNEIHDISCQMIRQYMSEGKYAEQLMGYEAVAAGFVDGDLEIIYKSK